jgi:hypothetical protein
VCSVRAYVCCAVQGIAETGRAILDAEEEARGSRTRKGSPLGGLSLAPETAAITRRNGERVNIIAAWLTPDALPIEVTAALGRLLDA